MEFANHMSAYIDYKTKYDNIFILGKIKGCNYLISLHVFLSCRTMIPQTDDPVIVEIGKLLTQKEADWVVNQYKLSKTVRYELMYDHGIYDNYDVPNIAQDIDEIVETIENDDENDIGDLDDDYTIQKSNKVTLISSNNKSCTVSYFYTNKPQCDCYDSNAWNLPCRHIFFVRAKHNLNLHTISMLQNYLSSNHIEHNITPNHTSSSSCTFFQMPNLNAYVFSLNIYIFKFI
jgi:hypothetical protein